MARGFSQTSPRRIGRTAGTLYGEGAEPDEDEEEAPVTAPVPSAPASAPTPVFRSGKGDYFR
jgi:hypothetical protein